jgi:hypothetical protein
MFGDVAFVSVTCLPRPVFIHTSLGPAVGNGPIAVQTRAGLLRQSGWLEWGMSRGGGPAVGSRSAADSASGLSD